MWKLVYPGWGWEQLRMATGTLAGIIVGLWIYKLLSGHPLPSLSAGAPAVGRSADRRWRAVQSPWGTCQGSEESGLGLEEMVMLSGSGE